MLDKEGKIKCTRTLVRGKMKRERRWSIYARVSSYEQKKKGDLERQIEYLRKIIPLDYKKIEVITDVASGLNDQRRGLLRLLRLISQGEITDVAITTKDRLTRFGFKYLQEYSRQFGADIHVYDGEEVRSLESELVEDMLSIVTSFSGKLYGIRSAKRKKLLENVRKIVSQEE